ncbi:MAG: hypothetical protein AB2L07_00530 [Thermoanaerobaculaceae bacterium]
MPGTSRFWAARLSTVVLVIAVCSTSPSAAVWCHGIDGHVRLEAAGADCCGHAAETALPGAPRPLGEHGSEAERGAGSGCGSCLDVPVSNGSNLARRTGAVAAVALVAEVADEAPVVTACHPSAPAGALAGGSPPSPTVLRL